MKLEVRGMRDLKRKLSTIQTQLDTTVEIQFELYLDDLIKNIQRQITFETGPNGPKYEMAKDKVFGHQDSYKVTGSLIKNIQNVRLPSGDPDRKLWSFGVQPIKEDTYSVNLIFQMFRTGQRGLAPDVHKLSSEIAQELETKYPNFKYFYRFIGENADVIRPRIVDELTEIITNIINNVFAK